MSCDRTARKDKESKNGNKTKAREGDMKTRGIWKGRINQNTIRRINVCE